MKSRDAVQQAVVGRGVGGLLLVLLLAPLLLVLGSSAAQAGPGQAGGEGGTLCLPTPGETGCIAGTMGTRADPIADVDVTLTSPDGTEQTVTTADNGRFSFEITEEGEYLVGVDPDTLPEGSELTPPANAQIRGPDGTVKVQGRLGRTTSVVLTVRPEGFEATTSKLDEVLQSSANGLRLGLLLALASVGLSLIYGTTGISNFAHAEQVTLGGMVGYGLANVLGLNLWLAGLLVIIICAFTGWFQDVIIWRPLRHRGLGLTQLMIVTIGLALAMQYAFQYLVGARTVRVVLENPNVVDLGLIRLSDQSLVAMAISAVVLTAVGYALLRTRIGRATRAVADNPALAQASGIDTDRVIRLVWTVGMGLAGLSGILYALIVNGIKWDTGLQILLLLFAAVTLGGLGTAFGALVGSLVIGLVVEMSPLVIPGDFKYAAALLILILVLLVRPQGLLGKAQRVG